MTTRQRRVNLPYEGEAAARGIRIRAYRDADYEQVLALWASVGWADRPGDRKEALAYKVVHDPWPFLVAELDGQIIGTAMGSWDGRWAWVNRLAVAADYRSRGIGSRLMREAEQRLAALGASHAALLTGDANPARGFYECRGYCLRKGILYMSKNLSTT